MKILILGHARHGKDEFAQRLARYSPNLKFISSSVFANERCVYPALRLKYGYQTPEECFSDRHNHRPEWHQLIAEYNADDPCRLCRELLEVDDVYVGMRAKREYEACMQEKLFDYVFWVDRSKERPIESRRSFSIECNLQAMIPIDNNWGLDSLDDQARIVSSKLLELQPSS